MEKHNVGESGAEAREDAAQDLSAYVEYAEQLVELFGEMSRLRASERLNKNMRGLPAVMRVLAAASGPLSPSEIAARTGVSDARVANALRSLEERGLVERRQAEGDRRRVEVSLTDEGRAQDARMCNEGLKRMAEFLVELGEEDSRDLIRLVGRTKKIMALRKQQGRMITPPDDPWHVNEGKGE